MIMTLNYVEYYGGQLQGLQVHLTSFTFSKYHQQNKSLTTLSPNGTFVNCQFPPVST